MKKTLLIMICCALLVSMASCENANEPDSNCCDTTLSNEIQDISSDTVNLLYNIPNSENNTIDLLYSKNKSMTVIFNNILQQQYTLIDFWNEYPEYQITAQSTVAVNIVIPEYENVVFVFSGDLDDAISEYKMMSVNAAGDVLLPEHFGKTFDKIIEEESDRASYVLADDIMSYKYEYIYIYRDDFYYFIRGFRHSNELTADNVAMFRYDENNKRPW